MLNALCTGNEPQVIHRIIDSLYCIHCSYLMKNISRMTVRTRQNLCIITIAAVLFGAIYGFRVIDPCYTDWLYTSGDLAQHYLGWKAFRAGRWMLPPGVTDTLAYPTGYSVIFTDSIPAPAILFKILSPILPGTFQYIGIWGLLCFILQGLFTGRILRHSGAGSAAVVLGSCFPMLLPCFLQRVFIHTALGSQWLIIAALDPVFHYSRYKENNRCLKYSAFLGLAAGGIHLYYLLIIGILAAAYTLLDMLRSKKVVRPLLYVLIFVASAAVMVFLEGGFSGGTNASGGDLGTLSLNLNAFFNSQGWSAFLQPLPVYDNLQDDGLMYPGLGGYLLMAAALILLIVKHEKAFLRNRIREIAALSAAFIIAFVFALSPRITYGADIVKEIPLPGMIHDLWAIFRATGRVSWICLYILVISGLLLCSKLIGHKTSAVLFLLCLLLQAADLHSILAAKHEEFHDFSQAVSILETKEFWNLLAGNDRLKHVVLTRDFIAGDTLYDVTDWAIENGKTVNTFYFSRQNMEIEKNRTDALENLSEENIYIFPEDNWMLTYKYDLHYYEADGLMIGVKEKLSEWPEAEKISYHQKYADYKNSFLDNGEDRDGVRYLYEGGVSYNEKWIVPAGSYQITIRGEGINENCLINVFRQDEEMVFPSKIVTMDDNTVVITTELDRDTDDLGVGFYNHSEDTVELYDVTITGLE